MGVSLRHAAGAGRRALAAHPAIAVLALLLAAAVGLRILLTLVYEPATLSQFDANAYVWQAEGGLFENPIQAPGYSLFLRGPHVLSDEVAFTVTIQHALAIATAVLAWWTVRRISGSDWLGLIPAAFVLLNGDSLLLEHSLMSETVFTFLLVAMLAAAIAALDSRQPWRWLALAGVLLGAAIWVRYAAVGVVPVLVVWALVVYRPARAGLLAAGAVVVPVALLVGALVVAQGSQTGFYGLGETGGWALYSRVAGFADCERFDPPEGTEPLCESTPPEQRRNPDWYGYNPDSPAVRMFGGSPAGDATLRAWAQRALVAQPLDYVAEVVDDLALFVDEESWTNRNYSLIGPRTISFTLRSPDEHCPPDVCRAPPQGVEGNSVWGWTDPVHGSYYAAFEVHRGSGVVFFQDLQRILRVHGPLLGLMIAIALVGLLAIRGRLAKAQWLLTSVALTVLVFPVATTTYNIRYAIPAIPILAAAAAVAPLALRDGAGWIGAAARRVRGQTASRSPA
jgi:hypothetical protein